MNTKEADVINIEKNKALYNEEYSRVNIEGILRILNNVDEFLSAAAVTNTSWVGLYHNDFKTELKGKRVLELGCGDCLNVAVMAVLGAEVYGNDIADVCGDIVGKINDSYAFEKPIQFLYGDFLEVPIPDAYFDIVVGKAFLHHLTPEQEILFTEKIVRILKKDGLVRYFEPAVNSKLIDTIRWMIPMNDRPSILQKEKFKKWKAKDPHPERDNSSRHYQKFGERYFKVVDVFPFGSIERFHRFLPRGKFNIKFRRWGFKIERMLPKFLSYPFARCHTVTYRYPIHSE